MNNTLETRVSTLEEITRGLAESEAITNKVIKLLAASVGDEIKSQVKLELSTREQEIEANVTVAVASQIEEKINTAVKETLDDRGLSKTDATRLEKARYKRMREILGDSHSDHYQLFIPFYQSCMMRGYRKKFNVSSYADISPNQFTEAMDYIRNFNLTDTSWCVKILHETYANEEFRTPKLRHAYERYFQITQ